MRITFFRQTFGCLRKLKLSNISTRPRLCPPIITMSTEVGPASATDAEPATKAVSTEMTGKIEGLAGTKRSIEAPAENVSDGAADPKKPKTEEKEESFMGYVRPFYQKRKVAMLLVYSGKGYTGMQMNPGMKTIEQDLLDALLKAGVVTEDHVTKPGVKMGFQRAARTDKGVSAAGQLVSLKIKNAIEKINSHLVDQIRVIGFKRVTRGFSSKDTCSSRTYVYVIPTFAFTPVEEFVTDNFKMSASLRDEVNKVLEQYTGTHKFHNFTSGKKATDPSAQRYIMEMKIGEPFMEGSVEYAVISVRGQSFMLHQIRKMIGLAIAIVRGMATNKSMEYSWRPEKADVPMAPGLGLVLDMLHFDAYNKRFGTDGQHEPIVWDEFKDKIEDFKHKQIFSTIVDTELKEKSMMKWLATLHNHHFETRRLEHESIQRETNLGKAANNIRRLNLGLPLDDGVTSLSVGEVPSGASTGLKEGATELPSGVSPKAVEGATELPSGVSPKTVESATELPSGVISKAVEGATELTSGVSPKLVEGATEELAVGSAELTEGASEVPSDLNTEQLEGTTGEAAQKPKQTDDHNLASLEKPSGSSVNSDVITDMTSSPTDDITNQSVTHPLTDDTKSDSV